MPSPRDEQQRLQRAILAHREVRATGAARGSRLAIYRHAYRARLTAALHANYPTLARLLGHERFRELALRYAAAHPSRHFSIRWHGHELGGFLAHGPLADLARMEWALGEVFDAADAAPVRAGDLASMTPEECACLPVALHPAVRVVALDWRVELAWRGLRNGDAVEPGAFVPHAHALLAWRSDLEPHWRSASREEAEALGRIHASGSLAAACESASDAEAAQLGAWFAGWVAQGMLVPSSRAVA
jgi:hypothetical protein